MHSQKGLRIRILVCVFSFLQYNHIFSSERKDANQISNPQTFLAYINAPGATHIDLCFFKAVVYRCAPKLSLGTVKSKLPLGTVKSKLSLGTVKSLLSLIEGELDEYPGNVSVIISIKMR